MATITKCNGKYRVQVRKGGAQRSKTYPYHKDTLQFARQVEAELESAAYAQPRPKDIMTVTEGLGRLWTTVVSDAEVNALVSHLESLPSRRCHECLAMPNWL